MINLPQQLITIVNAQKRFHVASKTCSLSLCDLWSCNLDDNFCVLSRSLFASESMQSTWHHFAYTINCITLPKKGICSAVIVAHALYVFCTSHTSLCNCFQCPILFKYHDLHSACPSLICLVKVIMSMNTTISIICIDNAERPRLFWISSSLRVLASRLCHQRPCRATSGVLVEATQQL